MDQPIVIKTYKNDLTVFSDNVWPLLKASLIVIVIVINQPPMPRQY